MKALTTQQTICRQFAELFSYPTAELSQTLASCTALLREEQPSAAASLERFDDFLQTQTAARIEEVFTATFDLQPVCYPYVGYQLCGENQQRGMFLMQLNQLYRQHGFVAGVELPDHLSTLLRFIGTLAPQDCSRELIEEGLLPALAKILQGLDAGDHPYADLLLSLQCFLAATLDTETELPAAPRQKECCS
ncbi:MAG: nitrate reductase molybdenum cofactor assembly chaperone [Trichloromonadaceae bacterium]